MNGWFTRVPGIGIGPGIALIVIVVLAGVRLTALVQAQRRRPVVSAAAIAAAEVIQYQRRDPDAIAILWEGPDGVPGQPGWDDDMNGVVDDRGELGAVHSDDRLVTPVDHAYEIARASSISRPMFAGVLVPTDNAAQAERSLIRIDDSAGRSRVWRRDKTP